MYERKKKKNSNLKLCLTSFETSWTIAHQGPLVHGILHKNTRVICQFLLQDIFPIKELKPRYLQWK